MDRRTAEELSKISRRVTKDMQKNGLEKIDKGPSMQDALRSAYKAAKTNSERKAIDNAMRRTEGMVEKDSYKTSEKYNQEVNKRMESEINKAIRSGKIKPADKHNYGKYMDRLHK